MEKTLLLIQILALAAVPVLSHGHDFKGAALTRNPTVSDFRVASLATSPTVPAAQCAGVPKDRTDCGYPHIPENECRARGCCFDSSIIGVNWCFYSNPVQDPCRCLDIRIGDRVACGSPDSSFSQCRALGCCYDPRFSNAPKCYQNVIIQTQTVTTTTTHHHKVQCKNCGKQTGILGGLINGILG